MRIRRLLTSTLSATALAAGLLLPSAAVAQDVAPSREEASASPLGGGEIVVTATRKSETLSKVPISVSAYGQEQIVKQGIRNVEDVVRLTPGINLRRGGLGVSNVAIRGISSGAGASTIGVYVDDTPIQVRSLGVTASVIYPAMFDLERVEVLRGPQGTLFGAGSEGGTIRFIQPDPSTSRWSGAARAEVGSTQQGASSYEAGFAVGGPIVADKVGFRASVYYRHDGGFIDKVTGTPSIVSATGALGAKSVTFSNVNLYKADVNSTDTFAARLALKFNVSDSFSITPSLNYQRMSSPDLAPLAWPTLSDFGNADYRLPRWNPTVDATHIALDVPNGEPMRDVFLLPSLKLQGDFGFAEFISTTSYFKRDYKATLDYTNIYSVSYASRSLPAAGDVALSHLSSIQRNFTQEVRFQSISDGPFSWVVGGFYTRNRQRARQLSETNFLPGLSAVFTARTGGAPFGAGTPAFINHYGVPQLNGTGSYYSDFQTIDTQIAGFGEVNYNLTEELKLTAGVRYSHNKIAYKANYAGPAANLNAPRGLACLPNTGSGNVPCSPVAIGQYAPGTGPFTPAYINSAAKGSDTAVTPKFGISYQATPTTLLYATASKGFRPSGAQVALPGNCNVELVQLGYVNGAGQAQSPETYDADSVWAYEGGAKTRLAGGRISLSGSGFYIKWKNIQSTVAVNSCLQSVTDNLGSATSKGFDLQASVEVVRGLVLSTAVGHTDVTFDDATIINGRTLFTAGSAIPASGSPWTVTVTGDYSLPIGDNTYYARSDFTYNSAQRANGATDPGSVNFDPNQPIIGNFSVLNARVGIQFDDFDISLFMNNALNSAPKLSLGHTRNQPVFTTVVLRPRTVGLTGSYRF